MNRFIGNLKVVEWLVVATVTFILGTFAIDEFRVHFAKRQGIADAQRDIAAGEISFRIGCKPRAWFDETAAIFRDRFDANLVRSHGCCPTCADWSYDCAYNDEIQTAVAQRIVGFSFGDAYGGADDEGRIQMETRLAGK